MPSKPNSFSRNLAIAFVVLLLAALALMFIVNVSIHQGHPGYYGYAISIQGLSCYKGGLVNDIIVPIPLMGGEQVFSDAALQNKNFGNWTSLLVILDNGTKMLAFQSLGENMTDIEAVFSTALPESITTGELSAAFRSPLMVGDGGEEESGNNRTTFIILPEDLRPACNDATPPLSVHLSFSAHRYFSSNSTMIEYQAAASGDVPPGTTGLFPLKISTGRRIPPEETFRPL